MTQPSSQHRHPRALLGTSSVLVSMLALAACSSDDGSAEGQETLVLSTFPFGVEEVQAAITDPFTDETGIEVEIDTGSNSDRLSQLQLAGGEDPGVDVVLISDYYAALGQQDDLFEEVTAEDVPAIEDIAEFAVDDAYAGPAYSYQLYGNLYNTNALDASEAASWDLWSDDALSGELALPDISVTAGQLMISGVGTTYGDGPYDIDAAFSQLADWSPNILQFYSSSTEVTNLLTQGEITAAGTLNGFATDLVSAGEPIAWEPPAQGRYMATNRAMIPAGAANRDAAEQFLDYLLGTEAQTSSAELVGDLPVNLDAEIPQEIVDVVGDIGENPEEADFETLDPTQLVDNRNEWVDRFAREVSSQ